VALGELPRTTMTAAPLPRQATAVGCAAAAAPSTRTTRGLQRTTATQSTHGQQ
jgi:hypothetical protein